MYQLQSRSINGNEVEVKTWPLMTATNGDEAFAAAKKVCPWMAGSPFWFAGTVYEIQRVEVVRLGDHPPIRPQDYD